MEAEIHNYFPLDHTFKLDDYNFPVAFGIEGYNDGLPRNDPQYVEWFITLNVRNTEGKTEKINLKHHVCTDEDFDAMFPPSVASAGAISNARANKSMFCLDKGQNIVLKGTPSSSPT